MAMIAWIRRKLTLKLASSSEAERTLNSAPFVVQFLAYIVLSFVRFWLSLALFFFSIPIHLAWSPQAGFLKLARRKNNGEFLESYACYLRQHRLSILSTMALLIVLGIELSIAGFGLYKAVEPQPVAAYSTTVDINPSWDDGGLNSKTYNDGGGGNCAIIDNGDDCQGASLVYMNIGSDGVPPSDCSFMFDNTISWYRAALKFSTASIPNNASITSVSLIVNVVDATNQGVTIFRVSTDTPDTLSCTSGSTLFNTLGSGTIYATATWSTTGQKNVGLPAQARTDVKNALTGSDLIAIGIRTAENSSNYGQIYSVNDPTAANRPVLRVTYTLPPQTSGTATPNHSANTTSSISWQWIDNATADTRYDVHDASHGNVTGCTNLAADSTACTETGLSANTQYTRHANVTDADGNTDGPNMSAYASIETPTGITLGTAGTTSVVVSASGTLSNLTGGSSGLYFENTTASTNSGWTQTNSWSSSSLSPNTQYSFRVKARNGDADETSFTGTTAKYTLSATPNVTSARSTSTWYTSGSFDFTNAAGWGSGGVQYYRYTWDQSSSHTFTGSESTWSNVNGNCPGGACTDVGSTLSKSAPSNGNNWYLHFQAFNGDNVANGSGTTYGPFFFDGSGPTISNLAATTEVTSATVTWTTSEPATTQLEWGTTTSYGNTTTLDSTLRTSHSVTLTGLSANTEFHARARSQDEAGNVGLSADLSFTTKQAAATVITNVQVTKNSPTSVTVTWTTNEPATSKVRYGTTTDYGLEVSDLTLKTAHSLTITGLTPNTTYHYEVMSTGSTTDTDADATFTTPSEETVTEISGVRVVAGETIATFFWTTNDPATSKVQYGTTSAYGTIRSDDSLVTSHRLQITNLKAGTTHHFQLESTGSTTATTSDDTFSTNTPTSTENRAIGPTLATPILDNGVKPTITVPGVAKGGGTLKVYIDGKPVKTIKLSGTATKTKSFAATISIDDLKPGKHTLYIQATDDVGRTSIVREKITFTVGGKAAKKTVSLKGSSKYVVQGGDSLWKIAARYLGDGKQYNEIVKANDDVFPSLRTNPSIILPGWTLTIPAS